jgi:hypothetical protein
MQSQAPSFARLRTEIGLDLVRLAKRLHCHLVNGKRRSLRMLAQVAHVVSSGTPFDSSSIARMVESNQ